MANKNREKKALIALAPPSEESVYPIVGVGASAGGIEAFTAMLKSLPDDPGMAFIFVLHQDPRYASNLDHVVARATKLQVEIFRSGMIVKNNHIYISPAGAEVSYEKIGLYLTLRISGGLR